MNDTFKSGFVNIIGNPNVGKSTLLNHLIGERLAIVTNKVQTTRHRIMGILTTEDTQIVFSDTPGILNPAYIMQEKMMAFVSDALKDADILLYVINPEERHSENQDLFDKIQKMDLPIIVVINKIDLHTQEEIEQAVEYWHTQLPKADILPISATNGFNTDLLLSKINALLPIGPKYYPDDQLTDKSERFIVNEVIREKILLNYSKEIPYAVEVVTERFREEGDMIHIDADIFVERDSQKGILIGHRGEMLSKIGKEARLDLQKFFGKNIFLKLYVRVRKNWRKNDNDLKRFGYGN